MFVTTFGRHSELLHVTTWVWVVFIVGRTSVDVAVFWRTFLSCAVAVCGFIVATEVNGSSFVGDVSVLIPVATTLINWFCP